jgi:putative ABC transport system permease protein
MVAGAGLVGLLLAIIGLYGLISYWVSPRIREIGIRMAIGASRDAVVRLVLWQGFVLCGDGILIGLVLSIPVFRLMSAGLAGLGGLTPWTLVWLPCTLILVAMAACCFPALRASRIDPNIALRYE